MYTQMLTKIIILKFKIFNLNILKLFKKKLPQVHTGKNFKLFFRWNIKLE